MGDDPVQVKFEFKEVELCENSRAVHISPHNSRTITDSEKSSIIANRKSTMGFPTSYQQGRVSPVTSPEWDLDTQICSFSQKFRLKPLKVHYKVSLSKTFSSSFVTQSTTYRTVSTFWQRMTPFP